MCESECYEFHNTRTLVNTSERESLKNYFGVRLVCMLQKQKYPPPPK